MVFGLLAVGHGRGQVFNEYFHSSPAVWRDYAEAGGATRRLGRGVLLEKCRGGKGAPSGARERVRKKGGVKGSAGGGRTSDAGRARSAPVDPS